MACQITVGKIEREGNHRIDAVAHSLGWPHWLCGLDDMTTPTGCAAFVLTLNDSPPLRPYLFPPPKAISVDFCNESDTRPTESVDRVSGARIFRSDFLLLFLSFDVREKQSLSPNLARSRREIKAVAAAVGASLMIRGMDGWIGCGSGRRGDTLATYFLRPLEFLPLSDSSYAENDFTPSDNIVVVVPRSRITFVVAADKFSRNVRQGGGRRRRLSPADGRRTADISCE